MIRGQQLTCFPDLLHPANELVDVIEQLSDNEIGSCVDLGLQVRDFYLLVECGVGVSIRVASGFRLEAEATKARGKPTSNTNAEMRRVLWYAPNVANEVNGVSEARI